MVPKPTKLLKKDKTVNSTHERKVTMGAILTAMVEMGAEKNVSKAQIAHHLNYRQFSTRINAASFQALQRKKWVTKVTIQRFAYFRLTAMGTAIARKLRKVREVKQAEIVNYIITQNANGRRGISKHEVATQACKYTSARNHTFFYSFWDLVANEGLLVTDAINGGFNHTAFA